MENCRLRHSRGEKRSSSQARQAFAAMGVAKANLGGLVLTNSLLNQRSRREKSVHRRLRAAGFRLTK
jgi:hypothetical protein